jgi:hypothetical protein
VATALALGLAAGALAPVARAQDGAAAVAPGSIRAFDSFSALRNAVLEHVSGATQRIWLVSDYLTDGEIVTALNVAQYRKLDVKVLLGRAKANAYMSRLSYLKNQSIPVFLKPDTFKPGAATVILADSTLLKIDGELDFLSKYKKYTVSAGDQAQAQAFATGFAGAASLQVPAIPAPIPMVGRPSPGRGRVYAPQPSARYGNNPDGAYTYGGRAQPRPDTLPGKLPKQLKYQTKHQQAPAAPAGKGLVRPAPQPVQEPAPVAEPPPSLDAGEAPESDEALPGAVP